MFFYFYFFLFFVFLRKEKYKGIFGFYNHLSFAFCHLSYFSVLTSPTATSEVSLTIFRIPVQEREPHPWRTGGRRRNGGVSRGTSGSHGQEQSPSEACSTLLWRISTRMTPDPLFTSAKATPPLSLPSAPPLLRRTPSALPSAPPSSTATLPPSVSPPLAGI